MKLFYTDIFSLPLPAEHRFPMRKYTRLRECLAQAELFRTAEFLLPHAATDEELLVAHSQEYLQCVQTGTLPDRHLRSLGFPWSPQLVERSRRSVGATLEACQAALTDGVAVNLAGGTHHAYRDRCEGYCVFNDAVVAARVMQKAGRIQNVLIIDCDVHQGNGTAKLAENDPTIFTFSIHGASIYPKRKETSDLDIALASGTDDETYLNALKKGLEESFRRFRADLVIYLAGADPYQHDRLGNLSLTKNGLAQRDHHVYTACLRADIPVAVTMAGGYSPNIEDIVDIHFQTVVAAIQCL